MSSKVRSALVKMLQDSNLLLATATAFENVSFTPPSSGLWYSVFYVPNVPAVSTLGDDGEDEVTGFLQIDINAPLGTGEKATNDKVDALRNVFTAGARAIYQGQEVVVVSCGRSSGRTIDSCFRVSVTIQFRANMQR